MLAQQKIAATQIGSKNMHEGFAWRSHVPVEPAADDAQGQGLNLLGLSPCDMFWTRTVTLKL